MCIYIFIAINKKNGRIIRETDRRGGNAVQTNRARRNRAKIRQTHRSRDVRKIVFR